MSTVPNFRKFAIVVVPLKEASNEIRFSEPVPMPVDMSAFVVLSAPICSSAHSNQSTAESDGRIGYLTLALEYQGSGLEARVCGMPHAAAMDQSIDEVVVKMHGLLQMAGPLGRLLCISPNVDNVFLARLNHRLFEENVREVYGGRASTHYVDLQRLGIFDVHSRCNRNTVFACSDLMETAVYPAALPQSFRIGKTLLDMSRYFSFNGEQLNVENFLLRAFYKSWKMI